MSHQKTLVMETDCCVTAKHERKEVQRHRKSPLIPNERMEGTVLKYKELHISYKELHIGENHFQKTQSVFIRLLTTGSGALRAKNFCRIEP